MRFALWSRFGRCVSLGTVLFLLQGCGLLSSDSGDDGQNAAMEVSVNIQDVHRCSRISPEIVIRNPPKNTAFYDVRLIEKKGAEETFFGGGSWGEDGSGVIPEGALTRHYRGPCPPDGESREYIFVVAAREGKNPQPLLVRICPVRVE